jgi:hypothetical protein
MVADKAFFFSLSPPVAAGAAPESCGALLQSFFMWPFLPQLKQVSFFSLSPA